MKCSLTSLACCRAEEKFLQLDAYYKQILHSKVKVTIIHDIMAHFILSRFSIPIFIKAGQQANCVTLQDFTPLNKN